MKYNVQCHVVMFYGSILREITWDIPSQETRGRRYKFFPLREDLDTVTSVELQEAALPIAVSPLPRLKRCSFQTRKRLLLFE